MKRLLTFFVFLIIVIVGLFFWWNSSIKPPFKNAVSRDFLILKGSSAAQIGNKLAKENIIKSPLAFKFYVQLTGRAKRIQAGEYRLDGSESLLEVVVKLLKGPVEVWVTIPEGLRREEVVERFIDGLAKEGEEAESFRKEFLSLIADKEGFLFPDTYLFPKTLSPDRIVDKMLEVFELTTGKFEDDFAKGASGLSKGEIIILASIIERETKTPAERPIIAGILLNRIAIGMGLQTDATVQYAVATANCGSTCEDWWPILTREDLEINSPYNTYKFRGLPPAPIASPGLSSIAAVINAEDSDYLYYLHDPKGQVHYAETLEEHNQNVRRFLGK